MVTKILMVVKYSICSQQHKEMTVRHWFLWGSAGLRAQRHQWRKCWQHGPPHQMYTTWSALLILLWSHNFPKYCYCHLHLWKYVWHEICLVNSYYTTILFTLTLTVTFSLLVVKDICWEPTFICKLVLQISYCVSYQVHFHLKVALCKIENMFRQIRYSLPCMWLGRNH